MKIRILLLFLATIFGIAAVFGVMLYLNSIRSKIDSEAIKVKVLIANQDIARDTPVETLISKNMVETQEIPQQFVVQGALENITDFADFLVATPISTGEQITAKKFISPADSGFSLIIPEGMIAVSLSINEVKGVSNLLNVGDKVNVIVTFAPEPRQLASACVEEAEQIETVLEDGTIEYIQNNAENDVENDEWSVQGDITKTLLWDVEILHLGARDRSADSQEGQKASDKSEDVRTVTLAVTPEQSEKLVFSDEFGNIRLALLPADGSITEIDSGGKTFENIFK